MANESMRRRARALLAFAPMLAIGPSACGGGGAARPHHLVLVTVDTLRADHLSAWGSARPTSDAVHAAQRGSTSPFTLDELAGAGTRFAHAYTQRGETFPSLCALFSGLAPPETGVLGNRETLPADIPTLAERLKSAGFHTAAFTTNKLLDRGSGIERGFDVFETDFGEERDANVLGRASAWIDAHASDEHAFVWVHLMGPHLPYDPRPAHEVDFARLFADPQYHGEANGSREWIDAAYTQQRALAPADVEHVTALYDGEIARIDQLVSGFAARLARARGTTPTFLDESLFVFCADHGESLHERHGYFGHSKSVYSDVLHVPLFMRWPRGVRAHVEERALVELTDVAPTVLATFGLPPASALRGRDLSPLLRGENDARFERCSVGLWRFDVFSITDGRWRLVLDRERVEPAEIPPGPYPIPELALYDRARDPAELVDVAREHPQDVSRLQTALNVWVKSLRVRESAGGPLAPERLRALQDQGYGGGK